MKIKFYYEMPKKYPSYKYDYINGIWVWVSTSEKISLPELSDDIKEIDCSHDTLSEILAQLDSNKQAQDLKNTAILAALNDINDRLNVLEDADHPPYTLV